MNIHGDDANGAIKKSLVELKKEVKKFLENITDDSQHQDISRLLGPLPYLLKDADYVAEHELRIIIAHLEYGAKEIQHSEPMLRTEPLKQLPNSIWNCIARSISTQLSM